MSEFNPEKSESLQKLKEQLKQIQEERVKVASGFPENKLPDYLVNYFDDKENSLKRGLKIVERRAKLKFGRKHYRKKDRAEYVKKGKEKFWEYNAYCLKKTPKTIGNHLSPVFEEKERNTEIAKTEAPLTPEERAALKIMCSEDMYLFAIRYFNHYLKKPSSELHKFLYKYLTFHMNQKKRKKGLKTAIAAPRSNSKSSVVSIIFPIWCIIYGKKRFIMLISDTLSLAEDFLSDIKNELLHNELLKMDFPDACGKGATWRSNEILTRNNVKVLSLGTGNQVRGRRFGVYRPDLVCLDDIESGQSVRSEAERDFIRRQWFDKDLMFVGGDELTDFLVVGTVLGKTSLLNNLLNPDEYPDWTSYRFKAVKKFSTSPLWDEWRNIYKNRLDSDREKNAKQFFLEHKEEMLEGTEVLWPEGDPYYDLMVYKVSNPSGFISEKQNSPIDPSQILVTEEQLHFEHFKYQQWKDILKRCYYYGALDPSLGKKSSSGDYSCICTVARDPQTGYLFVVNFDLKRRSVDDQILAIIRNHQGNAYLPGYNYKLFGVETNAFQYVVAESLRKKSREHGAYIPIKEIQSTQDKKLRLEGIVPLITDGTIVFDADCRHRSNQYNLAIEQITSCTGRDGEADDAFDALAMAVNIAKRPRFKLLTHQTRS